MATELQLLLVVMILMRCRMLLQLAGPADLLLDLLEALEEEEVVVGEDAHGPVSLARPLVGEHEGHALFLHLGSVRGDSQSKPESIYISAGVAFTRVW
jgi:hypothetical protein